MITKILNIPKPESLRLPALYKYVGLCPNRKGYICLFTKQAEGFVLIQPTEDSLPEFIKGDCYNTKSWKRLSVEESVILSNED